MNITLPSSIKVVDLVAFANANNCELINKGGVLQMMPRPTCATLPLETLRAPGNCDN